MLRLSMLAQIALGVGCHGDDCVRRYWRGVVAALAQVEASDPDEQHNHERGSTFHRNWRIFSLYLLYRNEADTIATPTITNVT